MSLGAQLKARREAQGRSISSVASAADITIASAHAIENGQGSWDSLCAYGLALGTRPIVTLRGSTRNTAGIAHAADVSPDTVLKVLRFFHRTAPDAHFHVASAEAVLAAVKAGVRLS